MNDKSRFNIPPIGLSGITSLTDVLSELAMPQIIPEKFGAKQSLFFHPRVAEEAIKCISCTDPALVSILTSAISKTNGDFVTLKDRYNYGKNDSFDNAPDLLKAILQENPLVFEQTKFLAQQQQQLQAQHQQQDANRCQRTASNIPSHSGATPQTPVSAMSDASSSIDDETPQQHTRQFFGKESTVLLEPLSQQTIERAINKPCHPSSSSFISKQEQEAMRKQIISIGKQPKAQNRKKKDMVSELFDSLTPAAEYFSDNTRRRRAPPRTYKDDYITEKTPNLENNEDESNLNAPTSSKHKRRSDWPDTKETECNDADDEDYTERPVTPTEVIKKREQEWQDMIKRQKEKRRRRSTKFVDPQELVESESYKKFCITIDNVFDNVEEYEVPAEGGEDDEIPSECLIPKSILADLYAESNKLKAMGVLNRVYTDRLAKLITVLGRNIKDGARLLSAIDEKGESDEDATWRELTSERVFRSSDSALIVLTIMTSSGMPKQVYVEDAIEDAIVLVKFQLQNVIFPAYDPVYRTSKDKKGCSESENLDTSGAGAKSKRSKSTGSVTNRTILMLYTRMVDLIGGLADLVAIQPLTDTTILHLCTLGVNPFFVENISELQLNALRLVSNIFNKYKSHRKLILEEILASLARLPSTKRSMRSYRLNAEDFIQMVTALVMQLVQSVVNVPSTKATPGDEYDEEDGSRFKLLDEQQAKQRAAKLKTPQEADIVVLSSYDEAVSTAHMFLNAYLKRCTTKSEDDYRPLFEAFVEDLLTAVHKPEWPAAELLLSLLGTLLVKHFSNKQIDMSLRVASLDYLGVVAARLRKDTVASQLDEMTLNEIILTLSGDIDDDDVSANENFIKSNKKNRKKLEQLSEDRMQILQRALVDYLVEQKENDTSIEFARQFYVAQWYKDTTTELERVIKGPGKKKKRSGAHSKNESDEDDAAGDDDDDVGSRTAAEQEKSKVALQNASATKQFLLILVDRDIEEFYGSKLNHDGPMLKESQAAFIVRWLASKRPLSQSFDIYLAQILRVLNETAVAVRTKAMKCLSAVVEADPGILGRQDVCVGVNARLRDNSSSVREAAIDLIGKFVSAKPELIDQYYSMLMERILDTGVSVRKRVIKILKEICERRPDYEKNAEICMRILRRVNDEESVKKLVCETFQGLWFCPVRERDTAKLLKKVVTITDVIGACSKEGANYDGFESLLTILLKKESDKNVLHSAKQIVNCLVENVLTLEEKLVGDDANRAASHQRMLCCLTTLYLFSKIKPTLMVEHSETMQPYLSMNCTTVGEQAVLVQVIKILEMVIPLMDHPKPSFLSQVEDILLKLTMKSGQNVVQASVSCAAAIINRLTKNWQKIMHNFQQILATLLKFKGDHEINGQGVQRQKPLLLRSLFTVGLMCQYFDFDSYSLIPKKSEVTWKEQVFNVLMYFARITDEEARAKAFLSLGFFAVNHPTYLMQDDLKQLYHRFLTTIDTSEMVTRMKIQVLRNVELFLREEEAKMMKSYDDWDSSKRREDLKEMGEISSGLGSSVIQHYLREVLECYFHYQAQVRSSASQAISLTLQQGLVHPVQCIPYVIAMCTDTEVNIKNKAESILKEFDSKYSGFIQMKASEGIKLSYRLQTILAESSASNDKLARGLKMDGTSEALNSYVYTLLRGVRQQRRAFLKNLLLMFDEISNICLKELVYVADNLASFPYQTLDEPLFVMHSIDLTVAVTGASLLQTFKENLLPKQKACANEQEHQLVIEEVPPSPKSEENENDEPPAKKQKIDPEEDDDDDDMSQDAVFARLPADVKILKECITASQGCVLLLMLKHYLKDVYGLTDSKIKEYSPSEPAKVYDKAVTRRPSQAFYPKFALEYLQMKTDNSEENAVGSNGERQTLCKQYLDFKQLMMSIDSVASDDDSQHAPGAGASGGAVASGGFYGSGWTCHSFTTLSVPIQQPVVSLTRLEDGY